MSKSKIGKSDLRSFAADLNDTTPPKDTKRLKRPEAEDKLHGKAKDTAKAWLKKEDKARVYETRLKGEDVFVIVQPKKSVGMVKDGDVSAFDKSGKLIVKTTAILSSDLDQYDE